MTAFPRTADSRSVSILPILQTASAQAARIACEGINAGITDASARSASCRRIDAPVSRKSAMPAYRGRSARAAPAISASALILRIWPTASELLVKPVTGVRSAAFVHVSGANASNPLVGTLASSGSVETVDWISNVRADSVRKGRVSTRLHPGCALGWEPQDRL